MNKETITNMLISIKKIITITPRDVLFFIVGICFASFLSCKVVEYKLEEVSILKAMVIKGVPYNLVSKP